MKQRQHKTIAERREAGLQVVEEILSAEARTFMDTHLSKGGFCSEISEIAIENVFGQCWSRPGLDKRARSLLTIGILIGLRSYKELNVHFGIAIKNGLSVDEIEEMIYHSIGYAGFPASNIAREAASEALSNLGMIKAPPHYETSQHAKSDYASD